MLNLFANEHLQFLNSHGNLYRINHFNQLTISIQNAIMVYWTNKFAKTFSLDSLKLDGISSTKMHK